MNLPEMISAGIGIDSKESINKHFNINIGESRVQEISRDGSHRITDLVERYREVHLLKYLYWL